MSNDGNNNVINLMNKEPFNNTENMSSEEKKDELVSYLIDLAASIDEGDLPADEAVMLFYKLDEVGTGFRFTTKTVGMYSTHAIALCELGKEIFIREMIG